MRMTGCRASARGNAVLRAGGDPLEFPEMSLRWSARVRETYNVKQPTEPPTAPLPIEHDIDGSCDFSSPFAPIETGSRFEVISAFVIFFGSFYLVHKYSEYAAVPRYLDPQFTYRETPYDYENSNTVYRDLWRLGMEDRLNKAEGLLGLTEEQIALRRRLTAQPYLERSD